MALHVVVQAAAPRERGDVWYGDIGGDYRPAIEHVRMLEGKMSEYCQQ